jgi:hypothetical protein
MHYNDTKHTIIKQNTIKIKQNAIKIKQNTNNYKILIINF